MEMMDQKYREELEKLDGREWYYTFFKMATISYRSLYIAAREKGLPPNQAASFCTSKWLRKTEDAGEITESMTSMWKGLFDKNLALEMSDENYELEEIPRTELAENLLRQMSSLLEITKKVYKLE